MPKENRSNESSVQEQIEQNERNGQNAHTHFKSSIIRFKEGNRRTIALLFATYIRNTFFSHEKGC